MTATWGGSASSEPLGSEPLDSETSSGDTCTSAATDLNRNAPKEISEDNDPCLVECSPLSVDMDNNSVFDGSFNQSVTTWSSPSLDEISTSGK